MFVSLYKINGFANDLVEDTQHLCSDLKKKLDDVHAQLIERDVQVEMERKKLEDTQSLLEHTKNKLEATRAQLAMEKKRADDMHHFWANTKKKLDDTQSLLTYTKTKTDNTLIRLIEAEAKISQMDDELKATKTSSAVVKSTLVNLTDLKRQIESAKTTLHKFIADEKFELVHKYTNWIMQLEEKYKIQKQIYKKIAYNP
jgi:chromosome segregation ATPase